MAQQPSTKVSDAFWPSLKKKLEQDPDAHDRLDIPCGICWDPTTIGGERYCTLHPERDHRACVLPCGHIFGDSCIVKHFEVGARDGVEPICPQCSARVVHPECGHACTGVTVPSHGKPLSTVPPTLEEGGTITELCSMCDLTDTAWYLFDETEPLLDTRKDCTPIIMVRTRGMWTAMFPGCRTSLKEDIECEKKIEIPDEVQDLYQDEENRLRTRSIGAWGSGDLPDLRLELHYGKFLDEPKASPHVTVFPRSKGKGLRRRLAELFRL